MFDESAEHVREILIETGNCDFFAAGYVFALSRCREMTAGFQCRTAGDDQTVREMAIAALAEPFRNVTGNFAARFGELLA